MTIQEEPRLSIFISHYAAEAELAKAWKKLLEEISLGLIRVWYSSDQNPGGGVPIGDWRTTLYTRLKECKIVLALQTRVSNGRPWIMWECGVASGVEKVRAIIPILYSIERGKLGNPLSDYQAFEGDNAEQVRELCNRLLVEEAGLRRPKKGALTPHIKAYMSSVQISSPQQQHISPEENIAYWREYLVKLVNEGRADDLSNQRQLMYSSLSKGPLSLPIHDLLSLYLLQQKKYVEALEEVDYGLALSPKNTVLLHRKAMILLGAKKYVEAQKPIEEILKLDKQLRVNPDIAGLQGRLHREQWTLTKNAGELDAAIEAYLRAYTADTTAYYPGLNAAELLVIKGRTEEGKKVFREVLATCQTLQAQSIVTFWVDFTAGEAFFALGETDNAVLEYQKGIQRTTAPVQWERESALGSVYRLAEVLQSPPEVVERIKAVLS